MVQSIPATHHFISRETCNSDFCTLKCTPRNLDKLKLLERIDYWMSFHTLSNRIGSFRHPAVNSRGMLKKHQFAAVSPRFLRESTRQLRWEKHEVAMWVTPGSCCELPGNQRRRHFVAAPFFCLKLGRFWPWICDLVLWIYLLLYPASIIDVILYTIPYIYILNSLTYNVNSLFPILKMDIREAQWCFLGCTSMPSFTSQTEQRQIITMRKKKKSKEKQKHYTIVDQTPF